MGSNVIQVHMRDGYTDTITWLINFTKILLRNTEGKPMFCKNSLNDSLTFKS